MILSNSPRSKIYILIASGFPMLPILFVCLQKQQFHFHIGSLEDVRNDDRILLFQF